MRISDWSSDVCSSDLHEGGTDDGGIAAAAREVARQQRDLEGARSLEDRHLPGRAFARRGNQLGRASWRGRECQYVSILMVAVSLQTKTNNITHHYTNLT